MQTIQTNKRILVSNVLFATDFAKSSKAALPYAIALARQYGAKVFIAHAIALEPNLSVPLDPPPANADPSRLDAERHLADLARAASVGNVAHEELLARGDVSNVLLDIAQKENVDLIVTATRAKHGLTKLVLGSNAEKIYRQAKCPVLTIGPHVPPLETTDWRIKHILFPTDGSEASRAALPYALSLAEENQATLILLQLMPLIPPALLEGYETSIRESLRALVPAEANCWCSPEFVVRFEFPAEGILRLAAERGVDLIVMGVKKSSSGSAISTHLPWAIASQVVAEAECPVLTVRG